ncbi:hypothetical protein RMATCC62417_13005 [Rhizopus microsporus]|nr:hypothetical protein RMATCC62417_13005 [Rhizopus microsporus]
MECGEATFNNLLIFPFHKAAAITVGEETNSGAQFKMGGVALTAMKRQTKGDGNASIYLAGGIIKLYGLCELEVLLLETSSHFGCEDKAKSSFDHHKGLFGGVSMLKTIADEPSYGLIEAFSKLKALFVHASGTRILLWSLKYIKDGPAYELWLEKVFDINPKFGKSVEQLPQALSFYWKLKCLSRQIVDAVEELKYEHKKVLKQCRFTSLPVDNRGKVVNPNIMKLTEAEDKTGLSEIGPFYTQ